MTQRSLITVGRPSRGKDFYSCDAEKLFRELRMKFANCDDDRSGGELRVVRELSHHQKLTTSAVLESESIRMRRRRVLTIV